MCQNNLILVAVGLKKITRFIIADLGIEILGLTKTNFKLHVRLILYAPILYTNFKCMYSDYVRNTYMKKGRLIFQALKVIAVKTEK